MIIIFEIDKEYCGFGIEWLAFIKGIRLGWIAIHFLSCYLKDILTKELSNETISN